LPPSGSISGVVRDMDGQPVARAHVSAQQQETASARTTTSAEDGSFELERVPAGKVVLLAGHPALGRAALALEIAPGQALTGQALVFAPPAASNAATARSPESI
jgi:hypothetical protein